MAPPLRSRTRPARRAAARPHVADPCPHCAADLGGAGSATRRAVVWTPEPGVFVWRCPECGGAWTEDPAAKSPDGGSSPARS